jgi:quercetin dioxygenase-like cupin family protein
MKRLLLPAGLLLLVGAIGTATQEAGPTSADHVVVRPDALKWGPPPPGLPPGSQAAILLGNPGKPGPFIVRAKMPDGYKVPPHWHSVDESLTVLQGTILVGHGDQMDPGSMQELGVGGFAHMPKGMRHYVVAKGETVIQVNGNGPFDITYINPADDPRKK